MEDLLTIINNPWVSGIGGGVISGFLVYFITSGLLSRKENKEYSQKVKTANNELLYAIRPLIAQKQIPSKIILESVITSTARKYEVNKEDLLTIGLLTDDLIREVAENAFLDSHQKMEFCEKINSLRLDPGSTIEQKEQEVVYQRDSISSKSVSRMFAFMTAIMVVFATFSTAFLNKISDSVIFRNDSLTLVTTFSAFSILLPVLAMTLSLLTRKLRDIDNDRKNKKEDTGQRFDLFK